MYLPPISAPTVRRRQGKRSVRKTHVERPAQCRSSRLADSRRGRFDRRACRSPKTQLHEHAMRVSAVVTEWPAMHKANACIERLSRLEGVCRTSLEAQKIVRPVVSHFNDMGQDRPPGADAAMRCRRSHGFYFAMLWPQLLERTASQQQRAFPRRPECNVRCAKLVQVQCMNAFRRRKFVHALQVFIQQQMNCRMGQIIGLNFHLMDMRFLRAIGYSKQIAEALARPVTLHCNVT